MDGPTRGAGPPGSGGTCGPRSVTITPLLQRTQDGLQFEPGWRQVIALPVPTAGLLVRQCPQHSGIDENLESVTEQVRRDAES